jgi:Domain of unknown function (DUF4350)
VRERLTTLACAIGALLVFITLFVHREPVDERAAPPTTAERGGSGLSAAYAWLQGEGIRTLPLRERLDTLEQRHDLPARGNLLLVILPLVTPYKESELRAIDRWVHAGNTLLVMAALSDEPDWGHNVESRPDLKSLTGLEFTLSKRQPIPDWREAKAAQARAASVPLARFEPALPSTLVPNRAHPYLEGVASAVAYSDFITSTWDVVLPRAGFVLELAHQRELGEGVLWVRPSGDGTLLISAFSTLFTNRALGHADNARLLANIVSSSIAPGGAVLFDDAHQGLLTVYNPEKFFRDRRLYATLGVLLATWLVWVLGGTRLRTPLVRRPAPREEELVRTTGRFLARVLRPAAAARRMFEGFLGRLQRRSHGSAGDSPWQYLASHPRLAGADVEQLRHWYTAAYADRKVPLLQLHNLIVKTERQLST